MRANEIQTVFVGIPQDDIWCAADCMPSIAQALEERSGAAFFSVGRLGAVLAYLGCRRVRIAQNIERLRTQARQGRYDIKTDIPRAEIAPCSNQHFMRKKALNIPLQPKE